MTAEFRGPLGPSRPPRLIIAFAAGAMRVARLEIPPRQPPEIRCAICRPTARYFRVGERVIYSADEAAF